VNWDRVHESFLDELEKISEISLAGLSPQAVSAVQPAPPMETSGLSKALAILDRANSMPVKLAARRTSNFDHPGAPTISRSSKSEPTGGYDSAKSGVLHGLAGLTGGGAVGDFVGQARGKNFNVARKYRFKGSLVGMGVAGAEFARKQFKARQEAKQKVAFAGAGTPGQLLNAARHVGTTVTRRPKASGPTLRSLTPKFGR
jgi:hypothetical protein